MQGLLSIACLFLLAAAPVHSQDCGIFADTLSHPTECAKYYIIAMHTCPDGLVYDTKTKQCTTPDVATCSTDTTTAATTTTPWESTTLTTSWPDTTPDTTTDSEPTYLPTTDLPTEDPTTPEPTTVPTTTAEPTTVPTTTPEPTTTPSTTTTTDLPTEETTPPEPTTTEPITTTDITTEGTTTTTTEDPPTTTPTGGLEQFPCPDIDDPNNKVRHAHESNCNWYYLCMNTSAVLHRCTTLDLHFNPIKKQCQPMNAAGCDRCPDVEKPDEIVRLPHETVCPYYYKCESNEQVLYQCWDTFYFSRGTRVCTTPEHAWCSLSGNTSPFMTTPLDVESV